MAKYYKLLSGLVFVGLFITGATYFVDRLALSYDFPKNNVVDQSDSVLQSTEQISNGITKIAERASTALVFISVSKTIKGMPFHMIDPFEYFFGQPQHRPQQNREPPKQQGLGSGFFVDVDKGYIVTNNHVIEDADTINLKLANGQIYDGNVIGRDSNTDIAIVKIKGDDFDRSKVSALSFVAADKIEVGEFVVALGAPFGLEASISFGVVSALGRGNLGITRLGNFIQTDAAINPGNSGGPLLNMRGEVVGVNTAIYSRTGGYNGIGFAVPASLAQLVGRRLVNDGKVVRGYIGVTLQSIDRDLHDHLNIPKHLDGALVSAVIENGPADRAGIKPGDVIIEIDGLSANSIGDVSNRIGLNGPNKTVELTIIRKGEKENIKIDTAEYPENDGSIENRSFDAFGLDLSDLNENFRKKFSLESESGVVVVSVSPNSISSKAGIQAGDLIISANGIDLKNVDDFKQATKDTQKILLRIERTGNYFFVSIQK
jgi:serine protease Do